MVNRLYFAGHCDYNDMGIAYTPISRRMATMTMFIGSYDPLYKKVSRILSGFSMP